MKLKLISAAALVALTAATPALAHHSFAMFERDKQVTLNGTVKQFQWTNPHSWIVVTVPTADGKSEDWAIESGSPLALVHAGWSRDVFKVGDRVTIVTKPLKNGEHGGSFVSAVLPGGRTLTE